MSIAKRRRSTALIYPGHVENKYLIPSSIFGTKTTHRNILYFQAARQLETRDPRIVNPENCFRRFSPKMYKYFNPKNCFRRFSPPKCTFFPKNFGGTISCLKVQELIFAPCLPRPSIIFGLYRRPKGLYNKTGGRGNVFFLCF